METFKERRTFRKGIIAILFSTILFTGFQGLSCVKDCPDSGISDILLLYSYLNSNNSINPGSAGVTLSIASLITSENPAASPQTFTIVLTKEPESGKHVDIEVSSTDTVEGGTVCDTASFPCVKTSPITFTFSDQNWNTPQTVYVKGADDAVVDTVTYFS